MTRDHSGKLSFREKFGYGLGDAATNFFFLSMILYQQRFYTDTVGLTASAVGWLFILVRLVDAVFDPIVGALSDRTQTRWGKFRPWVLFTGVPFGLLFWAAYSVPNLGSSGKMIYAATTYLLLMMAYSANNTPYAALTGVMTSEPRERTSISSYRLCLGIIGQLVITTLALPLVDKFGQGDSGKGWSLTIAIFASAIVVFNVVTFAVTKERVQPNPQQKTSFKSDLVDVFTCRPWVVMFFVTLFVFTTLALRGGSLNYYFSYYLEQQKVADFVNAIGLASISGGEPSWWKSVLNLFGLLVRPDGSNAASVGFSLFNVTGTLLQIVGIFFSTTLSDRFGKKTVFIVGLGLTTIVTAVFFFVPPTSIGTVFFLSALWGAAYGPTIPLLWSMIADVPDYSEWKNSRRATGFAFAGVVFALKAGLGLGGALGGWILAGYGYVANTAQTQHSMLGIRLAATVYAAIPFLLAVLVLFAYPITNALALRIRDELQERRKKYAATNA
ncbi:MFS transporter [Opitutaceae bacterium EW11]|nr:MFS transporter [Opitutaceae bacterium EW11]